MRARSMPAALLCTCMSYVVASPCLALQIGVYPLSSTWEWGPQYQPYGRTPVKVFCTVYSYDLAFIGPTFPTILGQTCPLDSRLILVNGEDVSYTEADQPMFPGPGTYDFGFEVVPAEGYSWPTDTFTIYAGGKGPLWDGGVAAQRWFMYANPTQEYSLGIWYSQDWEGPDEDGRWGDPFVVVGKDYTSYSRPFQFAAQPGVWVEEGQAVVVRSCGTMTWYHSTGFPPGTYTQTDGDGMQSGGGASFYPDLPWASFIGGVVHQDGSVTLLQSEGYPEGYIGASTRTLVAPATGFLGFRLNHVFGGYWLSYGGRYTFEAMVLPKNLPPSANPGGPYLCRVGDPCPFDGSGSYDPDPEDILTYVWDCGDGQVKTGPTTSHIYLDAGVYDVCLTASDGHLSDTECTWAVVYDPEAGFVTGGGWIDSPAGAYGPDPLLAGRANFGFVSKYQKGATVPTGNTEFQFKAGDFRFKSSSYEWLVVAGAKAMFRGEGSFDGIGGGFKFQLTAIDSTPDKFRIKIWNPVTADVLYDNKRGEGDDAEPTTIGGGSIAIHKK